MVNNIENIPRRGTHPGFENTWLICERSYRWPFVKSVSWLVSKCKTQQFHWIENTNKLAFEENGKKVLYLRRNVTYVHCELRIWWRKSKKSESISWKCKKERKRLLKVTLLHQIFLLLWPKWHLGTLIRLLHQIFLLLWPKWNLVKWSKTFAPIFPATLTKMTFSYLN